MKENTFYTGRFRRPLLAGGGWCMRVENAVHPGTPDVFYRIGGRNDWAELKYRSGPPVYRDTLVFPERRGLHPAQVAWWLNYLHYGGRGAFFVGVGRHTYVATPSVALVRGFNLLPWSEFQLAFRPIEPCFPVFLEVL